MFEIIQHNGLWELCVKTDTTIIPLGITNKRKKYLVDDLVTEVGKLFDKTYVFPTADEISAISNADGDIYLSSANGFVPNSLYMFYPVNGKRIVKSLQKSH